MIRTVERLLTNVWRGADRVWLVAAIVIAALTIGAIPFVGMLTLLQFFGSVCTTYFAAFGIFHDYKEEDHVTGRKFVTAHGRIAVLGVVMSGLLTLLTTSVESARNGQKAKEDRETAEAVRNNVQNLLLDQKRIGRDTEEAVKQQRDILRLQKNALKSQEVLRGQQAALAGGQREVLRDVGRVLLPFDIVGARFELHYDAGRASFQNWRKRMRSAMNLFERSRSVSPINRAANQELDIVWMGSDIDQPFTTEEPKDVWANSRITMKEDAPLVPRDADGAWVRDIRTPRLQFMIYPAKPTKKSLMRAEFVVAADFDEESTNRLFYVYEPTGDRLTQTLTVNTVRSIFRSNAVVGIGDVAGKWLVISLKGPFIALAPELRPESHLFLELRRDGSQRLDIPASRFTFSPELRSSTTSEPYYFSTRLEAVDLVPTR